jgi:hypothetical protein
MHINKKSWNLGLVRVRRSLRAESCIELIEKRLEIFGLNLHEDIECIATDGASVMVKMEKLLSCEQQLCLAHGINLGVMDVLYKKPDSTLIEIDDEVNCDSDDEEDDFKLFAKKMSQNWRMRFTHESVKYALLSSYFIDLQQKTTKFSRNTLK